MVNSFELQLLDGTRFTYDTKKYNVTRGKIGVEVLYRDEINLKYSVNIYPWHTVKRFATYGTLERK